jgi:hypothetical protein
MERIFMNSNVTLHAMCKKEEGAGISLESIYRLLRSETSILIGKAEIEDG